MLLALSLAGIPEWLRATLRKGEFPVVVGGTAPETVPGNGREGSPASSVVSGGLQPGGSVCFCRAGVRTSPSGCKTQCRGCPFQISWVLTLECRDRFHVQSHWRQIPEYLFLLHGSLEWYREIFPSFMFTLTLLRYWLEATRLSVPIDEFWQLLSKSRHSAFTTPIKYPLWSVSSPICTQSRWPDFHDCSFSVLSFLNFYKSRISIFWSGFRSANISEVYSFVLYQWFVLFYCWVVFHHMDKSN